MSIGPYSSLISSVSAPLGSAGALLKDPNAAVASAAGDTQYALAGLFPPASGPTDTTSVLGSVGSLTSSVSSYTTTKLSGLTTELPVLNAALAAQDKINTIDQIATNGAASNAIPPATAIANAFKPASVPTCPPLSGPSGPFSALMSGAPAALGAVTSHSTDAIGAIPSASLTQIYATAGLPPTASPSDLLAHLKTLSPAALTVFQSTVTSLPGVGADITAAGTSLTSSVSAAASSFTSSVATEVSAVTGMFSMLTSMNFLSLLSSPNPCVSSVLNATTSTAGLDTSVLAIADKPTSYNNPVTTAVATANAVKPLAVRPLEPQKEPIPPAVNTDRYEQSAGTPSIDSMKAMVASNYFDPLQALKAAAAAEINTIENWKVANQYLNKQQAAGATPANPGGTSTDPAAIAAWNDVFAAYVPQRDHYNNVTLPPVTAAEKLYTSVFLEYNRRRTYGKHPYTTMQAQGVLISPTSQTTYLDSTV